MSYVKYDELGLLEVSCMNCGNPVAVRVVKKVDLKTIPPKTVNVIAVKKLSSWRRKKYILDDGSYMDIILCSDCVDLDIPHEKIESEIVLGWEAELEQENKTKEEIKEFIKKLPKIEQNKEKIQAFKEKAMRGKHGI